MVSYLSYTNTAWSEIESLGPLLVLSLCYSWLFISDVHQKYSTTIATLTVYLVQGTRKYNLNNTVPGYLTTNRKAGPGWIFYLAVMGCAIYTNLTTTTLQCFIFLQISACFSYCSFAYHVSCTSWSTRGARKVVFRHHTSNYSTSTHSTGGGIWHRLLPR